MNHGIVFVLRHFGELILRRNGYPAPLPLRGRREVGRRGLRFLDSVRNQVLHITAFTKPN